MGMWTFEDVRKKYPEWDEIGASDEDIARNISARSGVPLEEVARMYGMDIPESNLGKALSSGWSGYKEGYAHIANAVPGIDTTDYIRSQEERQQLLDELNTAPTSFDEAQQTGDYLGYLGNLGANTVPYVGEIAASAALGPLIGAKYATTLGRVGMDALEGGIGTAARDVGVRQAAKEAALAEAKKVGQRRLATMGGFAGDYPLGLGDILGNQYDQSGEYSLGYALPAAGAYAGVDMLTGVGRLATKAATTGLGKQLFKSRLVNAAAQGGLVGAEGAGQETFQELLNQYGRHSVDQNYDPFGSEAMNAYKESAIGGGLLSAVPGAVVGGVSAPLSTDTTKQPSPEYVPTNAPTNLLEPASGSQYDMFGGYEGGAPQPAGPMPPVQGVGLVDHSVQNPELLAAPPVSPEIQPELPLESLSPWQAERERRMRGGTAYTPMANPPVPETTVPPVSQLPRTAAPGIVEETAPGFYEPTTTAGPEAAALRQPGEAYEPSGISYVGYKQQQRLGTNPMLEPNRVEPMRQPTNAGEVAAPRTPTLEQFTKQIKALKEQGRGIAAATDQLRADAEKARAQIKTKEVSLEEAKKKARRLRNAERVQAAKDDIQGQELALNKLKAKLRKTEQKIAYNVDHMTRTGQYIQEARKQGFRVPGEEEVGRNRNVRKPEQSLVKAEAQLRAIEAKLGSPIPSKQRTALEAQGEKLHKRIAGLRSRIEAKQPKVKQESRADLVKQEWQKKKRELAAKARAAQSPQGELFAQAPISAVPEEAPLRRQVSKLRRAVATARNTLPAAKTRKAIDAVVDRVAKAAGELPPAEHAVDVQLKHHLKRTRLASYRADVEKYLNDTEKMLDRSYTEKPSTEERVKAEKAKAERNIDKVVRIVDSSKEDLHKAKSLDEIAVAFADVQTRIPNELKPKGYMAKVDAVYEKLQFGVYEKNGRDVTYAIDSAKKEVRALFDELVSYVKDKKWTGKQLDMFGAISLKQEKLSKKFLTSKAYAGDKKTKEFALQSMRLLDIFEGIVKDEKSIKPKTPESVRRIRERAIVRGLQKYAESLAEDPKVSMQDAYDITVRKMEAAGLKVPDEFLSSIAEFRGPGTTVTASAGELAKQFGVRPYGQKIVREPSAGEKQRGRTKPTVRKVHTAKARFAGNRALESVKQAWLNMRPKLGRKINELQLDKMVAEMKKVNYPAVGDMEAIRNDYVTKQDELPATEARVQKAYTAFEKFVKSEESLVTIGGRQVQHEIGGEGATAQQLMERGGFTADYNTMQDYLEHGLTEEQQAAAVASGINLGKKVPATPEKPLHITEYRGTPDKVVSRGTYKQDGKSALSDEQIEGVNIGLTSLLGSAKRFLLNDAAGFGKTRQILAIADQYAKRTRKKVLIIHTGSKGGDTYNQFIAEAEALGIDPSQFEWRTYGYFNTKTENGKYGLVVLDEAQNIKNRNTKWHKDITAINADATMYATATPADTAGGMHVLAELRGVPLSELQKELGYVQKSNFEDIGDLELVQGYTQLGVAVKMSKIIKDLGAEGLMVRRQYPAKATPQRVNAKASGEGSKLEQRVLKIAEKVTNQKDITDALRRVADAAKVDSLIKQVKSAVAEGRKVVVFVPQHKKQSKAVFKLRTGELVELAIPDTVPKLEKALNDAGIEFVPFYGDKQQSAARFQHGDAKVVITTPGKGGVGLNLDDQVGNEPRTMIVAQLPYSAIEWQQMLGRVDRHSTKSKPEVIFLHAGMEGEQRVENILRDKLRLQNAATIGVPKAPSYISEFEGYTVTKDETAKPPQQRVNVSLNTSQDVTKVLKTIFTNAGVKARYVPALRAWNMSKKAWEKIEPQLAVALEALEMHTPKSERTTTPASGSHKSVATKIHNRFQVRKDERFAVDIIGKARRNGGKLTQLLKDIERAMPKNSPYRRLVKRLIALNLDVDIANYAGDDARHVMGHYDWGKGKKNPTIYLNVDRMRTLLHEAVHAATSQAIDTAMPGELAELKRLFKMAKAAESKLLDGPQYGLTDLHEFVAEAFTNDRFRKFLQGEDAPGLWRRFVNAVKRLLGMKTIPHSILNEVIQEGGKLFSTDEQMQAKRAQRNAWAETHAKDSGMLYSKLGVEAAGPVWVAELAGALKPIARGVMDTLRATVKLPMMSVRQISESYGEYFKKDGRNLLKDFYELTTKKERLTRHFQGKADWIYRDWAHLANSNPEAERSMVQVMIDATMNQFVIRDGVNFDSPENKHLRETASGKPLDSTLVAKRRKRYNEVAARWQAMPSEAKNMYNEVRKFFSKDWDDTVNQLLSNILGSVDLPFGNYTAAKVKGKSSAQLEAMVMADLKAYAAKEGLSKKEYNKWKNTTESVLDEVQAINSKARMNGDYFPLRRFGDYYVTARGKPTTSKFATHDKARLYMQQVLADDRGKDVSISKEADGYVVTVQDYAVRAFETRREAEAWRAEASEQYDEVSDVTLKEKYTEATALDGSLVQRISNRLGADETRLKSALHAVFVEMMPETSIHKAELRRKGVVGASEDMKRAFASYAKAASYYKAQLVFGQELAKAMEALKQVSKESHYLGTDVQPIISTVVEELKKRDALDITAMTPSKALDSASNIGFIWMLGTPSYWMVNATQPSVITVPWLAARVKGQSAAKAVYRAQRAIWPEIRHRMAGVGKAALRGDREVLKELSDFLTEEGTVGEGFINQIRKSGKYSEQMQKEIIDMLNDLGETGIIDMTFAADLRTAAEGGRENLIDKTTEWMRIMPQLVEVLNRTTTAVAAYEMARKSGKSKEASIKFADEAVASTQFDYSAANKPRYFSERQFKLARPVFMFMQYTQHMYYMLLRSLAQSSKGMVKKLKGEALTADEKAEVATAAKTFAFITATHALAAGAIGATFEPFKWAIGLAAWMFGSDDEPWDYEVAVRRAFADVFGKGVGEVLAKGVPYALGADLSTRINLNNLAFFSTSHGKEGKEYLADKVYDLLGPLGAIVGNAADAVVAFERGDVYRGIEKLAPKALRDFTRTVKMADVGIQDSSGKTILPSSEVSPLDLFYQSIGINPARSSEVYTRRSAVTNVKRHIELRRSRYLERYARARSSEERRAIWDEIKHDFNPGAGSYKIDYSTIVKSRKSRLRQQRDITRTGGINVSRKHRDLVEKYGDF